MNCDILVVGAGLTGCSAAYYLAVQGAQVLVVDEFELNTQASGSNAGSIHAQIPIHRYIGFGDEWAQIYAPTIPLMLDSIALWEGLSDELGEDLEFERLGGILVAQDEVQMSAIRRKVELENRFGLEISVISGDELRAIAPYVSPTAIGGAYCPAEGKANPLLATPAMARAACRHGARILTRTAVLSIEANSGGYSVTTDRGRIQAGKVVNCAGAAVGKIAAMLGIDLPIQANPIQVTVTEPVQKLVRHLVYSAASRLTMKQARNGSLLIGGGWPARLGINGGLALDSNSVVGNLRAAIETVPALADVQVVRIWPAIVNGTADWKPILGEIPKREGFYLAMFPWMGFTAGPIAGQLVARMILGQEPGRDLSAFSADRYVH